VTTAASRSRKRPQPAPREAPPPPAAASPPPTGEELDAAILRYLRRTPNSFVDLAPLAEELGTEPFTMQLAVEGLHRRRLLQAPFIEPGAAGGAELTEQGNRWLIEREGGKPADLPAALRPARKRVRAEAEAARLPRAQVYGVRRG
jgi:hypothetical protein